EAFDSVRGVYDLADGGWEGEERYELLPRIFPGGHAGFVAFAEVGLGELEQGRFGGVGVGGGVERAQRGGGLLAVVVGDEPHRGADQVHGAGLGDGGRPDTGDRFGQPGQPVAAGHEDVFDAAVAQLGEDLGPEPGAFVVLHPDPQHVLDAGQVYADD